MRIYISGQITGRKDYMNHFKKIEKELIERGMSVVNPAKINSNFPKDFTYEEYMKMDFVMIDLCDGIYMMKGWKKSLGANREYGYALGKNKIVIFEEDKNGKDF